MSGLTVYRSVEGEGLKELLLTTFRKVHSHAPATANMHGWAQLNSSIHGLSCNLEASLEEEDRGLCHFTSVVHCTGA